MRPPTVAVADSPSWVMPTGMFAAVLLSQLSKPQPFSRLATLIEKSPSTLTVPPHPARVAAPGDDQDDREGSTHAAILAAAPRNRA